MANHQNVRGEGKARGKCKWKLVWYTDRGRSWGEGLRKSRYMKIPTPRAFHQNKPKGKKKKKRKIKDLGQNKQSPNLNSHICAF